MFVIVEEKMKNILAYDVAAQYNFGGPSILHGLEELLDSIYGNGYKLTYLLNTPIPPFCVSDMKLTPLYIGNINMKAFFINLLKYKLRLFRVPDKYKLIFDLIKNADVVIDLYGICFCDNLDYSDYRRVKMILSALSKFYISFAAKRFHVRSVKNTSSFGPMNRSHNRKMAAFCAKHVFDIMTAREKESQDAMRRIGVRSNILLSPDIANLMKNNESAPRNQNKIGISTSHKIVRQWQNPEDYEECIANLCKHICDSIGAEIVLIPNESNPNSNYNDVDVSKDILRLIQKKGAQAHILDSANMTSSQIKDEIASCTVLIASRYHSCVAALSSGVPTFVIGWHFKYQELMHIYGQDEWILTSENCDSEKLIVRFDEFWSTREKLRDSILNCCSSVKNTIIEVGREMLEGK